MVFYIDVCVEYMDRVHFKKNPQCYQTNPKLEPSRTSKEGKAKKKKKKHGEGDLKRNLRKLVRPRGKQKQYLMTERCHIVYFVFTPTQ